MSVKIKTGWVPSGYAAWVPRPEVIVLRPGVEPTRRLIAHELVHVVQHRRYGLGFYLRYALGILTSWFEHADHPMEREAFENENKERFRVWAEDLLRTYHRRG